MSELFFDVPIDYSKPNEGTLRLFARSVSRLNKPIEPVKEESKLPWLVYLQGGPGFGCSPPQNYGWVEPVLNKGYQVRRLCPKINLLASYLELTRIGLFFYF